jgi:hypothetical protein
MPDKGKMELEFEAMRQIASALEPLDDDAKVRVIGYVMERAGLGGLTASSVRGPDDPGEGSLVEAPAQPLVVMSEPPKGKGISDIRSLVAEKRPKTANEMATIVAYYLKELAPQRKDKITVDDLEKYFKQGAYPLPKVARFTLTNAKEAGLLEAVGRGEYQLTSVGHNLVAHKMPTDASGSVSRKVRKTRTRPSQVTKKKEK